jgi:hypothetical protein
MGDHIFGTLYETVQKLKYQAIAKELNVILSGLNEINENIDWRDYEKIAQDNGYNLDGDYYKEYLGKAEDFSSDIKTIREECISFINNLRNCISTANAKASEWARREAEEMARLKAEREARERVEREAREKAKKIG